MRRLLPVGLLGLVALAGCGQPVAPREPISSPPLRLLPPPPLGDLDAPDAVYRAAVALQLQPGWASFLDDCRLRLPADHPLNTPSLSASVDLAVDPRGAVTSVHLRPSGNADFDRAVRQVIADAVPLPRPPVALWSDDDQVHLVWMFARDRRQAGPATAALEIHDLPVRDVVARLVASGDLVRAVRRIQRSKDPDRDPATHLVMVAALREGLRSGDANVRRAAIDAVGRAGVRELLPAMRDLLAATSDRELRLVALDAAVRLGDRAIVPIAADQLRVDARDDRRLSVAETAAMVQLGSAGEAATILRDVLDGASDPPLPALNALAYVWIPELSPRVGRWSKHTDSRIRAAACATLALAPDDDAWRWLLQGLRDRDASVRRACAEAAQLRRPQSRPDAVRVVAALQSLLKDPDAAVRARVLSALAALSPGAFRDAIASQRKLPVASDRSPEVRGAYASAIAAARLDGAEASLVAMLDDLDADVRAHAWRAWLSLPIGAFTNAERARHASRAAVDPASQVRHAAVPALDDDASLRTLALTDEASDVRTAAMVSLAARRGRAAAADLLLERLAQAPAGSAERVRTALAWLLAR
jgi:HEAT repeat protein